MGIIGSFQVFVQAMVMTNGGPDDTTLFYVLNLYRQAFEFHNMGYASRMAWVLFLILLGVDDARIQRIEEPGVLRRTEDVTHSAATNPHDRVGTSRSATAATRRGNFATPKARRFRTLEAVSRTENDRRLHPAHRWLDRLPRSRSISSSTHR